MTSRSKTRQRSAFLGIFSPGHILRIATISPLPRPPSGSYLGRIGTSFVRTRKSMMKCFKSAFSLGVLFGLIEGLPAWADDWPQWQGPERNNVSKETGLLKSWPKDGPKLLWTFEKAGVGYSGPAVVGERLYTMGGREDTSCVFAIDVKSGKELWSCPIGKIFKNGY